jgi:hypothetical protein
MSRTSSPSGSSLMKQLLLRPKHQDSSSYEPSGSRSSAPMHELMVALNCLTRGRIGSSAAAVSASFRPTLA